MHQIAYTARLVFAFANRSPLVAQLDRAPGFEPGCREFESLRAGQLLALQSLQESVQVSKGDKPADHRVGSPFNRCRSQASL